MMATRAVRARGMRGMRGMRVRRVVESHTEARRTGPGGTKQSVAMRATRGTKGMRAMKGRTRGERVSGPAGEAEREADGCRQQVAASGCMPRGAMAHLCTAAVSGACCARRAVLRLQPLCKQQPRACIHSFTASTFSRVCDLRDKATAVAMGAAVGQV